jgi:hypothetical protein
VPDPTLTPSLAAEMADLRRRLDTLERTTPLKSAAVRDGRVRFLDTAGNERVVLGVLGGGLYGVRVLDALGAVVFEESA